MAHYKQEEATIRIKISQIYEAEPRPSYTYVGIRVDICQKCVKNNLENDVEIWDLQTYMDPVV